MTSIRLALPSSSLLRRLVHGQMRKAASRSSLMMQHSLLLQPYHKPISTSVPKFKTDKVTVHFELSDGERQEIKATVGDNLLDIIVDNDVDIDGFGACEGTLACSTCHLIFSEEDYDKIPDKPTDEELDMLDLAFGLSDTSRLGCQVIVTKDMDGMKVVVPANVADARSGGL